MIDHTLPSTKILMRSFNGVTIEDTGSSPYAIECTRQELCASAKKLHNGIYTVPPNTLSSRYYFHHAYQVILVILEGHASLRVTGEVLLIKVGDVIFMPPGPEYPFQLMNPSEMLPFKYLVISARDKNEKRGYPDSNKFLVDSWLALNHGRCFEVVPCAEDNLRSKDRLAPA